MLWAAGVVLLGVVLGGCIALPERNEQIELTRSGAAAETERMRAEHVTLVRPVVVLNGYHGVPTLSKRVQRKLMEMTSGRREDFINISYTWSTDLDAIAAEVVRRVDEA